MKKIALAAMVALLPVSVQAQANAGCAPYERITMNLEARYSESKQNSAIIQLNAFGDVLPFAIEMWANPETGTFTIIRVSGRGTACAILSGKSFKAEEAEVPQTSKES